MSLQWTLIAGFLYFEIAVVLLLVLPIASPQKWQRFFKSRLMQTIERQAAWYFAIVLFVLILFLLDAIREMRKYSGLEHTENAHSHLDAEMQTSMKLFRSQRNFYISGFALFLSFVIRRLVILITSQAQLMIQYEAAMKQAKSATTAARGFLAQTKSGENEQNSANEAQDSAISKLKSEIESLEKELEKEKNDKEALKSQADSVSKEYDRLSEEHRKLQETCGGSGDKKRE